MDEGKSAFCFGSDRIIILFSMATDIYFSVRMGTCCGHSSAIIFDVICFIFVCNEDNHNILDEFDLDSDRTFDLTLSDENLPHGLIVGEVLWPL